MKFADCIPTTRISETVWRFELQDALNGGFGGTNGGVLAAICLHAARHAAPAHTPAGIDARFVRSFPPGVAQVQTTVLNQGRTLTTVSVDGLTLDNRLAVRATVSLVNPKALAEVGGDAAARLPGNLTRYEDADQWRQPRGQPIPLIKTFGPRTLAVAQNSTVTATRVLWDDPAASAEAACIAADISVGPPVARALKGRSVAMPNPDLTLRFSGAVCSAAYMVSDCCLVDMTQGLATTAMTVFGNGDLIAAGVSTTTCLSGGGDS